MSLTSRSKGELRLYPVLKMETLWEADPSAPLIGPDELGHVVRNEEGLAVAAFSDPEAAEEYAAAMNDLGWHYVVVQA